MTFLEGKDDNRPARGGWAPGLYQGTCPKCGSKYLGAKRSRSCADCAYAEPDGDGAPSEHELATLRAAFTAANRILADLLERYPELQARPTLRYDAEARRAQVGVDLWLDVERI